MNYELTKSILYKYDQNNRNNEKVAMVSVIDTNNHFISSKTSSIVRCKNISSIFFSFFKIPESKEAEIKGNIQLTKNNVFDGSKKKWPQKKEELKLRRRQRKKKEEKDRLEEGKKIKIN